MKNVQDYIILYNNAVRPVLGDGCHFTYMCNTLA